MSGRSSTLCIRLPRVDAHAAAAEMFAWLHAQPAWIAAGTVGLVTGLEYVAPPVPGDTVAIACGALVAQGILRAPVALAVVTFCSVLGALAAYGIGRLAAKNARVRGVLFRFIKQEHFEAVAVKYRRHGRWLLVMNRFFPGVRASFIFAAGMFGLPVTQVALLCGLSALVWNSLLIGAGAWLGANIDDVIDLVARYSLFAWTALAIMLAALLIKLGLHYLRPRSR